MFSDALRFWFDRGVDGFRVDAVWPVGKDPALPDAPPLAPGPMQCAHAVSGAILLAAVARQPEKAPDKYRQFIEMGLELAQK